MPTKFTSLFIDRCKCNFIIFFAVYKKRYFFKNIIPFITLFSSDTINTINTTCYFSLIFQCCRVCIQREFFQILQYLYAKFVIKIRTDVDEAIIIFKHQTFRRIFIWSVMRYRYLQKIMKLPKKPKFPLFSNFRLSNAYILIIIILLRFIALKCNLKHYTFNKVP